MSELPPSPRSPWVSGWPPPASGPGSSHEGASRRSSGTSGPSWVTITSSFRREPFALLIKGHRYARNFAPWAVLGLVSLWKTGQFDARGALLLAGTAYGAVHYFLQGKGWEYQLYPAAIS